MKSNFTIKILLFNILLFGIFVLFGEIAVRSFMPNIKLYKRTYPGQYLNHTFDSSATKVYWAKKDSMLGWTCKASSSIIFTNQYYNNPNLEYIINKQGFRNRFNFDSNTIDSNNIMMIGDSFLFGVYLSENHTIPNVLDSLRGSDNSTYNLGIPGFGIDQMYLSYLKYQEIINPRLVVLFYIDDDIQRVYEAYRLTEGMNKPSFKLINNKLVLRKLSKSNLFEKLFENSYLLNKFYRRFSEYKSHLIAENLFVELERLTRDNNQKFVVIRCPTKDQVSNKNDFDRFSFKEHFNDLGVPYYELHDVFDNYPEKIWSKFYLEFDGHLSEKGNEIVADFIFNEVLLKNLDL
ncbi:MAG: SGNH/GDSL hydrolase family protein [Ignavibacteriae bacterium]|nr:SGNH/GDSL hydrolase family protein [Ignavibacteriota bacterium]